MRHRPFLLAIVDDSVQANILIDRDSRPRLTDYGLLTIMSDPNVAEPGSAATPSPGSIRFMAPELLNPTSFGLKGSIPTKGCDIYAFGMVVYQVSRSYSIPDTVIKRRMQITTGRLPFPGVRDGVIIYSVATGQRPDRPSDLDEWPISDAVWDLISRCWSSSLISRPDARFVKDTLENAAYGVEVERTSSHRVSGTLVCHPL